MPSPREIAKQVNDASKFEEPTGYDAEAGVPQGVSPQKAIPDPNSYPTNPPEKPAPARNLKR